MIYCGRKNPNEKQATQLETIPEEDENPDEEDDDHARG